MKRKKILMICIPIIFLLFACLTLVIYELTSREVVMGATTNGGGVYIDSGAIYTMDDGVISEKTAESGGGVYVGDGTFIMNDGTISDNAATLGGGVYVCGGTFIMNGGLITNNYSEDGLGGAVFLESGTFEMIEGTISGNYTGYGGNIYIGEGANFNYYSGTIDDDIELSYNAYITYKGQPTSVHQIRPYSAEVGTKIAKLSGISYIDLSMLDVWDLEDGTQLELQTIGGEQWVVIGRESYTLTFSVNSSSYGYLSRSLFTVEYGATIVSDYRTLTITSGSTQVTITAFPYSGYDVYDWTNGNVDYVTSSMTIIANFKKTYTVSFVPNRSGNGTVSMSSVVVFSGTTMHYSGYLGVKAADGTNYSITATPASTMIFDGWLNYSGAVTSDRTVTANFRYPRVTFSGGGGSWKSSASSSTWNSSYSFDTPKGATFSAGGYSASGGGVAVNFMSSQGGTAVYYKPYTGNGISHLTYTMGSTTETFDYGTTSIKITGDVTISALYDKAITLTFKASPTTGGSVSVSSLTVATGMVPTNKRGGFFIMGAQACRATAKSGYTFTSWSKSPVPPPLTESTTITAFFSKTTFLPDGSSLDGIRPHDIVEVDNKIKADSITIGGGKDFSPKEVALFEKKEYALLAEDLDKRNLKLDD